MDVSDIRVNSTNTNSFGNQKTSGNGKPKSNFLPPEEWNTLTQELKDQLIVTRRQEEMVSLNQANIHEEDDFVNLDDIVAYTTMNHDVTQSYDKDIKDESPTDNALLAYMAGSSSSTSPGDLQQVTPANHAPNKNKTRKANKSNSAQGTFQFGDLTYYFTKGETIVKLFRTHHVFLTELVNMMLRLWKRPHRSRCKWWYLWRR
jgi:hypothetical protein